MSHHQPDSNQKVRMWWPIIIQTIGLLLVAFGYSTTMEHRITQIEMTARYTSEILQELKTLNASQDIRLRMLEANQGRILAMEERRNNQ